MSLVAIIVAGLALVLAAFAAVQVARLGWGLVQAPSSSPSPTLKLLDQAEASVDRMLVEAEDRYRDAVHDELVASAPEWVGDLLHIGDLYIDPDRIITMIASKPWGGGSGDLTLLQVEDEDDPFHVALPLRTVADIVGKALASRGGPR